MVPTPTFVLGESAISGNDTEPVPSAGVANANDAVPVPAPPSTRISHGSRAQSTTGQRSSGPGVRTAINRATRTAKRAEPPASVRPLSSSGHRVTSAGHALTTTSVSGAPCTSTTISPPSGTIAGDTTTSAEPTAGSGASTSPGASPAPGENGISSPRATVTDRDSLMTRSSQPGSSTHTCR